ncbi:MAG: peptidoglycan bridge formation glycyltransferase FemA/FemB family protein [Candidatus Parcubacteria bacterium]|nr:peptidoglycan bridge formation glycyltransferase FemA/FemB family protein [Candidatus Parcubacteria bacterium]
MFSEVTNKELWDKQIGSQKMSQFLQSWAWGEFQQRLGRQIWRLDLAGDFILVIKMNLPLGKNYLYIPRTNCNLEEPKIKFLKELANNEKSIFIKIEPLKQTLENFGFKKVKPVQPAKTLMLDLSKSEEELLVEMHQKTRYNIHLAEKKGVSLKICEAEEFPIFYDLLVDTYRRKGKKLYGRDYFHKLYHDHLTKIYCAEYQGKILCANMIVFYGDIVTYLHGGSSEKDKNIMAPHLLQWEIIKKAKELGYKYYDFWGIEERYPGVARFKRGFGGFEVDYIGAWDLTLNKFWYLAYKIIKSFK